MIGRLSGRLAYKGLDHVMLDVAGVGYIVHVSERTLAGLPAPGEAASLWTELIVREDLMQLMGFASLVEKEWFRLLTSVQGIGAKSALGILGALGPDGVGRALALGDWTAVKAAPGVGPKIAQRVVNELKDKAPAVMAMGAAQPAAPQPAPGGGAAAAAQDAVLEPMPSTPAAVSSSAQAEAMSALANLGYAPSEAARAVAEALGADPEAGTAQLIRASLKLLAPKG